MTLAPSWPDDPETVEEARRRPEVFAHKRVKHPKPSSVAGMDRAVAPMPSEGAPPLTQQETPPPAGERTDRHGAHPGSDFP